MKILYAPVKKKKKIITKILKKFKNLIEEMISISLKKDMKGGKPKFKPQTVNHNSMKKVDNWICPLRENNLRLKELLYSTPIRKNIQGEMKPCASIISRQPICLEKL